MFAGQYLGIALGGGGAMFVNGRFGFEAALAGVAALLLLSLLFVVMYVRDPQADATLQRQAGVLARLYHSMVSFVKEVYASFWQSGSGPKIGVAFALLPIVAHGLFFGMANIAISTGNYWQGLVAESMGYSVVLYLDALFAVLVILVIPFLRDREDAPAMEPVTAEPLLASE